MSTVALVQSLAPEFDSLTDELIETFIGYAALMMNGTNWNGLYSLGNAYLTAHLLKIRELSEDGDTLGGGPIASERVGDLSRSFGSIGGTARDRGYQSTRYGIEYLNLRNMLPRGPLLVTADDC